MSLNTLLSVVILVAFIVTVVLAIGSYAAYKLREQRRPKLPPGPADGAVYFERYFHRPSPSDAA